MKTFLILSFITCFGGLMAMNNNGDPAEEAGLCACAQRFLLVEGLNKISGKNPHITGCNYKIGF